MATVAIAVKVLVVRADRAMAVALVRVAVLAMEHPLLMVHLRQQVQPMPRLLRWVVPGATVVRRMVDKALVAGLVKAALVQPRVALAQADLQVGAAAQQVVHKRRLLTPLKLRCKSRSSVVRLPSFWP